MGCWRWGVGVVGVLTSGGDDDLLLCFFFDRFFVLFDQCFCSINFFPLIDFFIFLQSLFYFSSINLLVFFD